MKTHAPYVYLLVPGASPLEGSSELAPIWVEDDRSTAAYATTSNSTAYRRLRRFHLEREGEVSCSYCPPHRGENSSRTRYGHGARKPRYRLRRVTPPWRARRRTMPAT